MNSSEFTTFLEENNPKVLRPPEANSHLSQCKLADALGFSLGKINYRLRALLPKGFIKIQSFKKSQNKLACAYLLSPMGFTEKAWPSVRFLAHKVTEYKILKLEIEALKSVMNKTEIMPVAVHD